MAHQNANITRSGEVRLRLELEESSVELQSVLHFLQQHYNLTPYEGKILPKSRKGSQFQVRRERSFSSDDLDACTYLVLSPDKNIASHGQRTEKQIEGEQYVADSVDTKNKSGFGFLSPFSACAVSCNMKKRLEEQNLRGLDLSQSVLGVEGLWKLSSKIVLPESLLPLVDGKTGEAVPASQPWNRGEERYYDDGGYEPPVLQYDAETLNNIEPFDIALTAERTGQNSNGAYRWCVVSQQFRKTLKELKVPSSYFPVHIV